MALVFQELTFRVGGSGVDLRVLGQEPLCRGAWWSSKPPPTMESEEHKAGSSGPSRQVEALA